MNCGTDIVEIKRIRDIIENNNEMFLNRIYTEKEIEYCEKHNAAKYQHYAARFSAKEAVSKCLGTGFSGNFDWKDIEIENDELGCPKVILYGKAKEYFSMLGYREMSISMSHCKEYATSVVVGY